MKNMREKIEKRVDKIKASIDIVKKMGGAVLWATHISRIEALFTEAQEEFVKDLREELEKEAIRGINGTGKIDAEFIINVLDALLPKVTDTLKMYRRVRDHQPTARQLRGTENAGFDWLYYESADTRKGERRKGEELRGDLLPHEKDVGLVVVLYRRDIWVEGDYARDRRKKDRREDN